MSHSKQFVVIIVMIFLLLTFGTVLYLYLSTLSQTPQLEQPVVVSEPENETTVVPTSLSEEEIRVKLETAMRDLETEASAASSSEIFNRLDAVMAGQVAPETNPYEIQSRLEAVMNNN